MRYLTILAALALMLIPSAVSAQGDDDDLVTEVVVRASIEVGRDIASTGYARGRYGSIDPADFVVRGNYGTLSGYSYDGEVLTVQLGAPLPATHYLTTTSINGVAILACRSESIGTPSSVFLCPATNIHWTVGLTYDIQMVWEAAVVFSQVNPDPSVIVPPAGVLPDRVPPSSRQSPPVLADVRVRPMGDLAQIYFNWTNNATLSDETGTVSAQVEWEIDSKGTGTQTGRIPSAVNQNTIEGVSNLGPSYPLTLRLRYVWDNFTAGEVVIPESSTGAGDGLTLAPNEASATMWGPERLVEVAGNIRATPQAVAESMKGEGATVKGDIATLLVAGGITPEDSARSASLVVEITLALASIGLAGVIFFATVGPARQMGQLGVFIAGGAATLAGAFLFVGIGTHVGASIGMLVLVPGVIFGGVAISSIFIGRG